MTDEETRGRRFRLIRDLGDDVAGAARSVTGQSARDKISEFTDAYTEVLTGLDDDVKSLRRRVGQIESYEQASEAGTAEGIAGLQRSVDRLHYLVAAAISVAIVAVVVAIAI